MSNQTKKHAIQQKENSMQAKQAIQNAACCAEQNEKHAEQHKAVQNLHHAIKQWKQMMDENASTDALDDILWQAMIAYQSKPFYTSSGLPFSYTVKRNKSGEYSGELLVSRKEQSKTLTRSSVFFAFHKVLKQMQLEQPDHADDATVLLIPAMYRGPKAIGQIFGISYVYSLFWNLGLIEAPEKVAARMNNAT